MVEDMVQRALISAIATEAEGYTHTSAAFLELAKSIHCFGAQQPEKNLILTKDENIQERKEP